MYLDLGDGWFGRQQRKSLIEEYPYLQPRKAMTGEVHPDYDYDFIVGEYDLPKGWLDLFLQMCEDIKVPLEKAGLLNDFRFLQVKEKFGQLRAYNTGGTEEVYDIISKYEFLSEQVCCMCGKPATAMTRGWICPFCEEHTKNFTIRGEIVDPIEIKTEVIRKRYHNGTSTETIINCKDEWTRYLKRIGYSE
jgi:hypothetical protein